MKFVTSMWASASSLLLSLNLAIAQEEKVQPWAFSDDWELAEGLTLDIDTEGYYFPSHILFVDEPGPLPTDPLYFVLELKGKIKVVTKDP